MFRKFGRPSLPFLLRTPSTNPLTGCVTTLKNWVVCPSFMCYFHSFIKSSRALGRSPCCGLVNQKRTQKLHLHVCILHDTALYTAPFHRVLEIQRNIGRCIQNRAALRNWVLDKPIIREPQVAAPMLQRMTDSDG